MFLFGVLSLRLLRLLHTGGKAIFIQYKTSLEPTLLKELVIKKESEIPTIKYYQNNSSEPI